MKTYFLNHYPTARLLRWLHECVDENVKGAANQHEWWSDGSAQAQYRSKNTKWKINVVLGAGGKSTLYLEDEYTPLYELKFK